MQNAVISAAVNGEYLQPADHSGGFCSDQGSIDQYNVLIGITLEDETSNQGMFYQASFGTGAVQKDQIVNTTFSPQYFEVNNGNVWGFDDSATSTIGKHIPFFDDNSYAYSFDVLPRLKYAISNDPSGKLDQNLNKLGDIRSLYRPSYLVRFIADHCLAECRDRCRLHEIEGHRSHHHGTEVFCRMFTFITRSLLNGAG